MSKIEQTEGYVYKYKVFALMTDLLDFLNNNGIRHEDIVEIIRDEIGKVGGFNLLYKDWGD